jgi:hypothetical protein
VTFPKVLAQPEDALLEVCCEEASVDKEGFFLEQRPKVLGVRVNVLDRVVGPVLAGILSRELEAVGRAIGSRQGVVDEVNVLGGPLLVVLDKLVVKVASRKVVGTVLIVA